MNLILQKLNSMGYVLSHAVYAYGVSILFFVVSYEIWEKYR